MTSLTVEHAKEWLAALPIEEQRYVNKSYDEYAKSKSPIFRMGKDEFLMTSYSDEIQNDSTLLTGEDAHIPDAEDGKSKAEKEEKKQKEEKKNTQNEDIELPQDEAQQKVKMMKVALMLLTAGALWVIL